MNSSRLPGKALLKIGNKPLLQLCIESISRSKHFIPIIATSREISDQPIYDLSQELGVECFRGDLENVALRTKELLELKKCSLFARVNGDSPLVDGQLLDKGFEMINSSEVEIVSNIFPVRSYPYGMSVEILKTQTFLDNFQNFQDEELEHITSFFYKNIEKFKHYNLILDGENAKDISLVVDNLEDLNRMRNKLKERPTLFDLSYLEIIVLIRKEMGLK